MSLSLAPSIVCRPERRHKSGASSRLQEVFRNREGRRNDEWTGKISSWDLPGRKTQQYLKSEQGTHFALPVVPSAANDEGLQIAIFLIGGREAGYMTGRGATDKKAGCVMTM